MMADTTMQRAGTDAQLPGGTWIAGGTQIVDLMQLGILRPETLVDLGPLRDDLRAIERSQTGLRIGSLATMSEVAAHPDVQAIPALHQSLVKAASPQIRNMASMGGNLLQRTRCTYFRDAASPCNKREPGTGCGALEGDRHGLAILGTSNHCVANYPGDLAVALVALDANIEVRTTDGSVRTIPAEELHALPGSTPHIETVLDPGDLITAIAIPDRGWTASAYIKVRERASYAFALASCAVAARLDGDGTIADIRIAVGGLAAKPWSCKAAERLLIGNVFDAALAARAAQLTLEVDRAEDEPRASIGRRALRRATEICCRH